MIKLDGQFTYLFSLLDPNNLKVVENDFISAENLNHFLLYECAGGARPTLELTFEIEKESTVKYLNKGNILTISFGINEPTQESIQFEILNDDNNKNYSVGYAAKISAALYKPKFTATTGSKGYGNITSIEVFKQIAESNKLNLKTNITRTNDKQDWNRVGLTEWKYLQDVWLVSYINDKTFTSFGIDHDSIYLYDMRELCKQTPKWIFSNTKAQKENTGVVHLGGNYFTKNVSGSIADLVGKNLQLQLFDIDKETFSSSSYNLKNFTTIENLNKLDVNNKDCMDYSYDIISDDVHENYIKAYNQNIRNNIMYSGFNIYCTTALQFNKIHLFDLVRFDTYPVDERLKGTAIIAGIAYEFQDGKFNINITLNKEAPSGIKGEGLKAGD